MSEGSIARLPRRRDSLQWRFMAAVAAIAVVFSVVAGVLSYRIERGRAQEQAQQTLEGLVAAVERTLAIGAYTRDKVLLAELAGGLAHNELVAAIDVVDTLGEPLAQVGRLRNEPGPAVIERRLISPFDAAESVATLRVRADAARIAVIAQREAWRLSLLQVAAGHGQFEPVGAVRQIQLVMVPHRRAAQGGLGNGRIDFCRRFSGQHLVVGQT